MFSFYLFLSCYCQGAPISFVLEHPLITLDLVLRNRNLCSPPFAELLFSFSFGLSIMCGFVSWGYAWRGWVRQFRVWGKLWYGLCLGHQLSSDWSGDEIGSGIFGDSIGGLGYDSITLDLLLCVTTFSRVLFIYLINSPLSYA